MTPEQYSTLAQSLGIQRGRLARDYSFEPDHSTTAFESHYLMTEEERLKSRERHWKWRKKNEKRNKVSS